MTPAPHSHAGGRSLPLSRWIIALITAGLSVDEAMAIVSRVQRDQINAARRIAA